MNQNITRGTRLEPSHRHPNFSTMANAMPTRDAAATEAHMSILQDVVDSFISTYVRAAPGSDLHITDVLVPAIRWFVGTCIRGGHPDRTLRDVTDPEIVACLLAAVSHRAAGPERARGGVVRDVVLRDPTANRKW